MCLPDFVEFKNIKKSEPLIGYRTWRLPSNDQKYLISLAQDFIWDKNVIKAEVSDKDSGIYAYNNYYNYYNNYNNYYNNYYYNNCYYNYNNCNYNNCNNNYNNYYNNNCYIGGIINQYGKVAIHKTGYRSQYATIKTLFSIKESDAKGPKEFLDWITEFNKTIKKLAKYYKCNTMHYQDFTEKK